MEPYKPPPLDVDGAIDRLSHYEAKPVSKLNPMNWPPKVKAVVGAALVAGLAAAGVPQAIVAAVAALFGG